jgi:hypothetical protein
MIIGTSRRGETMHVEREGDHMIKVKVFLASSSELMDDRKEFEVLVNRKNKEWVDRGVFLELVQWEDFLDVLSQTRLQNEYNAQIRVCDLFVMLFWTKVGRYTEEEFETAVGQFKATEKPFILVYFKDWPKPAGPGNEADRRSLEAFQAKLATLGHYKTAYDNVDHLKAHFSAQLDKLVAKGFIRFDQDDEAARRRPFQAPPPDADHVLRAELSELKHLFLDAEGRLRSVTVGLHGFGGVGKTTLARLLSADAEMRKACRDGMLWVPVGKNPPDPRAQIADLVVALLGNGEGCLTLAGARARLQSALAGRRILVVLDDVWDEAQARDIAQASAGGARLITTRNTLALPQDAQPLDLAAMQIDESRRLLGFGLPPGLDARLDALASRLGHWPLLLKLANRTLRQRIAHQKTPPAAAVDAVENELSRKSVLAFDPARQVQERDQAVAATIGASLEMLDPSEGQRCAELAIFPQDVPIPLAQAAELWRLTGNLDAQEASELVLSRLDPLSLLDYDGAGQVMKMHEVLRSYLATTLADKAGLHNRLAAFWGDRPPAQHRYAWRWLAFHRAAAIAALDPALRHAPAQRLVAMVGDGDWQQRHKAALADLPALREALASALDAAVADEARGAVALIVEAADALVRFDREHASATPVFELARDGDLYGARRRSDLVVSSVDVHWGQALLMVVGWLAPPEQRDAARALLAEVQRELGPEPALHDLLAWVRADLHGENAPVFDSTVAPSQASRALIEQLLSRVGGGSYDHELLARHGLDPGAQNPDMPTRGLYHVHGDGEEAGTTTSYLAEADGPWLVVYAANDFEQGTVALDRYLSVYTNYSYAEYRYATLWLLLGHVVRLPRRDGGGWVRDAVVRIISSALSGASVEFEESLSVAVRALRARAGEAVARQTLEAEADRLIDMAARLKPGRDREGSDIWAHDKRRMLAHAQALGWLLNDSVRAKRLLEEAVALADSGFAGYQAMACLALAETLLVVTPDERSKIDAALEWAQRGAHNVQDATFCARVTARVNAMRHYWWTPFEFDQRARRVGDGVPRVEFAALHYVGHAYPGRRPHSLLWPSWAADDRSFEALARLYQRPKEDFQRLNGADRPLAPGDKVAVPDRGFMPHLGARLAAEVLALAGLDALSPERAKLLRTLVPRVIASPTALDAVLARLVLAEGRREAPQLAEAAALEALLARRRTAVPLDAGSELIATRLPA